MNRADLEAKLAAAENEPQIWTCPTHEVEYGDIAGALSRMWACPECKRQVDLAERRLHAEHSRYRWWLAESGIPARYRAATPDSIQSITQSSKALASAVAAYTKNLQQRLDVGEGLVLLGPPGLGKTVGLTAVINAACAAWHGPIYAAWPDVIAELKAGFNGPRDDPRRMAVERLRNGPFIALDELGVKGMTDFDHEQLFSLVDYRYREQLPTLAASNVAPANFSALVGERIADRLRETGPQLVLSGESLRGKVVIEGAPALPEPPGSVTVQIHEQGRWRDRVLHGPERWP